LTSSDVGQKPDAGGLERAEERVHEGPRAGPGKARFAIRILATGEVVFGDLPEGLAEVARVVAGEDVTNDHLPSENVPNENVPNENAPIAQTDDPAQS